MRKFVIRRHVMFRCALTTAIVIFFTSSLSFGGQGMGLAGDTPDFWKDRTVVVAKVVVFRDHVLNLELLSFEGGTPIPGAQIVVDGNAIGTPGSPIEWAKVKVGDIGVFCLERKPSDDGYQVTALGLQFSPSGCGVVVLNGVGDPVLTTIRGDLKKVFARYDLRMAEERRREKAVADARRMVVEHADAMEADWERRHEEEIARRRSELRGKRASADAQTRPATRDSK
jgi:hypothetical protein